MVGLFAWPAGFNYRKDTLSLRLIQSKPLCMLLYAASQHLIGMWHYWSSFNMSLYCFLPLSLSILSLPYSWRHLLGLWFVCVCAPIRMFLFCGCLITCFWPWASVWVFIFRGCHFWPEGWSLGMVGVPSFWNVCGFKFKYLFQGIAAFHVFILLCVYVCLCEVLESVSENKNRVLFEVLILN